MNPPVHSLVCVLILLIGCRAVSGECMLDLTTPLPWNDLDRVDGSWGGFLNNRSCDEPFERYLYVLAKEANRNGNKTLPNTAELKDCMSELDMHGNGAYGCGLERLTRGNVGCSSYTVMDVGRKLGSELWGLLDDHCKHLDLDGECGACLGAWEKMDRSDDKTRGEAGICKFMALVYFTSRRVNDVGWIKSVYTCLRNVTSIDERPELRKKKTFPPAIKILIGGIGAVLLIALTVWLIRRKQKIGKTIPERVQAQNGSFSEDRSSIKISLKEVYLATDNLSASNFIGQGIAGKVYKGTLSSGQLVAVKHILNDSHMESFVREVTSLSHIKHPNLVELLGHCDGEDESFLIYELCDNGNLSEWLFGKDKFLTWNQRLEIAIDCANGLQFLHTYIEGCIVHRDIKPTNILLGFDFHAKLSDFGLSKVINKELSYVSSEVRGTFGYVDPEYQKDRHVHSSTDVYSFGIVLLQVLSGQRVINLESARPMTLSKMAKNLRKGGDIAEFADPKLDREFSAEAFQMVLGVALCCIGSKQQRPSMEKVVAVLRKAHSVSTREWSLHPSFQA